MSDELHKAAVATALAMYAGEPCRVCGHDILPDDLGDAVFAGYAKKGPSRAAHGRCWRDRGPKREWAYPEEKTP